MAVELSSLIVIFETSGSCFDAVTINKIYSNLHSEHFCKKRLRNSVFFSETLLSYFIIFITSSDVNFSFVRNNSENKSGFFSSWSRTPRFLSPLRIWSYKIFRFPRISCTIRFCDIKFFVDFWKQEENTLALWIFEVTLVLKLLKRLFITSTHSGMLEDEIVFVKLVLFKYLSQQQYILILQMKNIRTI